MSKDITHCFKQCLIKKSTFDVSILPLYEVWVVAPMKCLLQDYLTGYNWQGQNLSSSPSSVKCSRSCVPNSPIVSQFLPMKFQ